MASLFVEQDGMIYSSALCWEKPRRIAGILYCLIKSRSFLSLRWQIMAKLLSRRASELSKFARMVSHPSMRMRLSPSSEALAMAPALNSASKRLLPSVIVIQKSFGFLDLFIVLFYKKGNCFSNTEIKNHKNLWIKSKWIYEFRIKKKNIFCYKY